MNSSESILERIEQALEQVRPYLNTDGGDVKVEELTADNVLKIRLIGACGTCPQSYMTFKTGIETSIMQAVPEITKIIPLNFFPEDEL